MDEYRIDEHRLGDCRKNRKWNYIGIILATLLGSFLAFYFVASCTVNHFISHAYMMKQMRKMEKIGMHDFNKMDKAFSKDFNDIQINGLTKRKSTIELYKTPDAYKFVVDLTPFQGNSDVVKIDTKGRELQISAESAFNKNNTEAFTKMSQTYMLSPEAKLDKLSKKKVDGKYIITVPIED